MIQLTSKFLQIYLDYFKGREEYIAVQGDDGYYPMKTVLDENLLLKHLSSIETFGCYVLTKSSQCNFVCIDIDINKSNLESINFKDTSIKFETLKNELYLILQVLINELGFSRQNILLEDTGGRGYHIWLFFESPIEGYQAVHFGNILKLKHKIDSEFFPKQGELNEKIKYGNLIKLPLGEHKVYEQKSRFFSLDNDKINFINSLDDNLSHLEAIEKVPISKIEILLENNIDLVPSLNNKTNFEILEEINKVMYKKDIPQLFHNCSALNSLQAKASNGIKLSHTEAFHLVNLLLSVQIRK